MTHDLIVIIEILISAVVMVGSAVAASIHALLTRRTPAGAFGWVGISLLFPPIGPLLYYLFGINRVHVRAQRLDRASRYGLGAHRPGPYVIPRNYTAFIPLRRSSLAAAGDRLSSWPVEPGNDVRVLCNGNEAYPEMLAAIEAAERFVYFTTYIFETNGIGRKFIDALAAANERGVDVRVLIDGVGEWYALPGRMPVKMFEARGVPVARFLPPRLWPLAVHINLRNHRKILVTDKGVAFTGGMNIGDRHLVSGTRGISDLHFRLTGPIVRQIEAVFLSNWAFATGVQTVVSPHALSRSGRVSCRAVESGPTNDIERLDTLLVTALASAYERVFIVTPYFLPSPALVGALQSTALRGVEVSVVMPQRNNLPFVGWAAKHDLGALLDRGVNIYFQRPPFAHTKLFIIDDDYALIGSPNIDARSLRLNFELAIELYDEVIVSDLAERVLEMIGHSEPYTKHDLSSRSWLARLRDAFCWLFSPYL